MKSIKQAPVWRHLPAIGGYLLLSMLVLAPVLSRFGSAILGGPVAAVDGWQNVWNVWWVQRALASGTNPFHTDLLYFPYGVDLYLQTLNITNGVLFWPVTALWGPITGYNAAVLLALLLSGLGGYALALRVSGDRLAAFVGGCVFAFSPFHLTKIWDGQLELVSLQWIAFYALFLLRAVEDMRRRDALLAALFLALVGYTSWYYLLFTAVYSILFVVLWLLTTYGMARRRSLLTQAGLAALGGGLLLAPILLPALHQTGLSLARFDPSDPFNPIFLRSANLLDFWLPSTLHPLWGAAAAQTGGHWHPSIAGWNMALGYTALALALLGGAATWRAAWRWWLLAVCALLLALGPVLQVGMRPPTLWLPYALLLKLPGVGAAWRPSHFVVLATLLLAPLSALGVRWLLGRVAPRRRWMLVAAVLALVVLEYAPPRWPLHARDVNPYYASLPPGNGAVLELPPPFESGQRLEEQTVHGRPILAGYVSRQPEYLFADQVPGVRQLWLTTTKRNMLLGATSATDLMALNYYGIEHVIVHWNAIEPAQRKQVHAVLASVLPGVQPTYADDVLSAYRVPRVTPRPFAYFFGTGWYKEENAGTRRWRWLRDDGALVLVNPTPQAQQLGLRLRLSSYQTARPLVLTFGERLLLQQPITPREMMIDLTLRVPPGEHRLRFQAPASPEAGGDRQLSIVLIGVDMDWQADAP